MTKPVRYQKGQLYQDHGAWFVRYRDRVRQGSDSVKLQRRTRRLGSVDEFPTKSDVEMLRTAFMQKVNAGQFSPDSSMMLSQFVESAYLPWVEAERRASTNKGYREIWENHIRERIGQIRLREFRTVHASKMLRTIADECDLTKTTLQHIKSVLSGVFTYAKNEGAYDGFNPVQGAMIPGKGTRTEGDLRVQPGSDSTDLADPAIASESRRSDRVPSGTPRGRARWAGMAGLQRRGSCGHPIGVEGHCEPTENPHEPATCTR